MDKAGGKNKLAGARDTIPDAFSKQMAQAEAQYHCLHHAQGGLDGAPSCPQGYLRAKPDPLLFA
jgi:hypothetical protein